MKKFLSPDFLIPTLYSLLCAALMLLSAAALAASYGGGFATAFFFRAGYPILAAASLAALVSPLALALCIWLSLRCRRAARGASPLYRNLPLVLTVVTQGLLLAALIFSIF
ncbi:MAG: hypothetical protein Q4D58_02950 [Synergistaceae bacterium]|nr:hypothetical protein [Synergistaceae bacterium]